jgi:alkanesulfonate monooxygenase
MRLVARHADGWNTVWAWSPDAYADRVRALAEACEAEGRDPATVRRSLGLSLLVGESDEDLRRHLDGYRERTPGGLASAGDLDEWRADRLAGTPAEIVERLGTFAELGVEETIVSVGAVPFAVHDPNALELFASRVLPEVRGL